VSIDLIVQIVTMVLMVYFGFHLRSQLRTLKHTVEAQKATIDAQAKHREEFEALMRAMKQVLDVANAPAMLQQMQVFKAMVEANSAEALERRRGSPPLPHQAKMDWDPLTYDRPR
jgi:predicted Holliday junction resolvase-like endonuclease